MANLPPALEEEDVKRLSLSQLKKEYIKIAGHYSKILDNKLIHCCKCNEHLSADTFYTDNNYASGKFPICKKCIMAMVEQRYKKNDIPNETKESVQKVLMMMDLPYDDAFYNDCVKGAEDGMKEKNRKSPFATYITCVKSLPQYRGKRWIDSDFGAETSEYNTEENIKITQKDLKAAKKRFGPGYSNEDLMYLWAEYQDWTFRYECNTKAQEAIFERLAFKKWEINKATKEGKPTKDLDKTYTELLTAANVTPRQNVGNSFTESLTFGQLIEKWEETKPIPSPDPEFADVNNIGKFIRVWFKGALMRALNLDGGYNEEYDEYIKQYSVQKPEDIASDDDSTDNAFDKIFGMESD